MDSYEVITEKADLRARYGERSERAVLKQLDHLDQHCRAFIALSPFLVIGTMGADGLGAIVGSMAIASVAAIKYHGRIFLGGSVIALIMSIGFALSNSFATALPELATARLNLGADGLGMMHAARALQETHEDAHPTYQLDDWLLAAKRVMVLGQNGRISFDYDMALGDAFRETPDSGGAPPANLWLAFESLGNTPLLLVRGALSNLLSEETVRQMKVRNPGMEVVLVPDTGHAPMLDEPEAVAAIDALLAKVRTRETV